MPEPEFVEKYEWLIRQMKKRNDPPPEGVVYPVWAWYKQMQKNRSARWGYGSGDEDYTCIEFEIPDGQMLLKDFDSWHIILNNGLFSDSEKEADQQDAYFDSLPTEERKAYKETNWEQVFDTTPFENDWTRRGDWVQATIWELRKDMIQDVRFFRTGTYKRKVKRLSGLIDREHN